MLKSLLALSFLLSTEAMEGAGAATRATVRLATRFDLPRVHDLIRQSYGAMNELTENKMVSFWSAGAEKAIVEGDLREKSFVGDYLESPGGSFWVAECDSSIVGCVGLKQRGVDDAELVRMSVDESQRGKSIGALLISTLISFCQKQKYLRIHLVTANTRAASFYRKCGFLDTHNWNSEVNGGTSFLSVSKMTKFLGERLVRSVAVIGGTHGNERIGVELVQQALAGAWLQGHEWPSLRIQPIIGNPLAAARNIRFVDEDLNRQFASPVASSESSATVEGKRGVELLSQIGPKSNRLKAAFDFCIDLHSSTSNVGLVVMLSAAEADPLALGISHALAAPAPASPAQQQKLVRLSALGLGPLRVTSTEGTKADSWSVDSITPSGLSIEVGPLAHGTVSHSLFEATRLLVECCLDNIDARNQQLLALLPDARAAIEADDAAGGVGIILTPDNSLWKQPKSAETFSLQTVFVQSQVVPFPRPDGVSEQSKEYLPFVVHPHVDGPNWRPIRHGDPLFIASDGSGRVLPFSHPSFTAEASAPPAPLYSMFVNEAAYTARGIALALYEEKVKPVLLSTRT